VVSTIKRNDVIQGKSQHALFSVCGGGGGGTPFPIKNVTGAENFSLHHRVQNGSGAHPASYPIGTRCSFPGGKAAGA
jgi:hypothetical protein